MRNILADIFGRQVPQQIARQNAIQSELYRTRKEIETKMAVPIASTGTPISELNGMARTLAIMANMGDGSIATGGRGVRGGEELMAQYNRLVGMAAENDWQNKLNTGNRRGGMPNEKKRKTYWTDDRP